MRTSLPCLLLLISTLGTSQLQLLNDEFNNGSSITNWSDNNLIEGWNIQQLAWHNINDSLAGNFQIAPHTCAWFNEWRGPMMYKLVSGDFVVTTEVLVTNRNGVSVPSSIFSLAGILIRSPLSYTNGQAGWSSGEQNYIFLSVGTADNTCTPSPCVGQLEVKTTVNSNSTLSITDIPDTHVQLRFARIDSAFIILYRHVAGGNWIVHQRYNRPDFPDTLQVGFTTYTDWPKVQGVGVNFHNNNVLIPGVANDPQPGVGFNPDLIANFDFYRIDSVTCPITINCNALTNSGMVSTNDLLGFLGYDSTPYCPRPFSY